MTSNSSIKLVDTSVLVNIRDVHGDSSVIWQRVEQSVKDGKTKTVRQVWDELKERFPDVYARVKHLKRLMVIPDADLYAADAIAEHREIQRHHPKLINMFGNGNPADPFLIAAAKGCSGIVVTDEKVSGKGHKNKIPYVCKNRNVGCLCGSEWLKEIGCDV